MPRHTILLSIGLLSVFGCGDDSDAADGGRDASSVDSSGSDIGPGTDAIAADATAAMDAPFDAAQPDVGSGRVPLFLAMGWGGRYIASCDMGRTWINDTSESAEDDWHQNYTPKSLAYHDGVFVRMTGWGANGNVHTSRDGLTWTSVQFAERSATSVGYDERWVILSDINIYESNDGVEWGVLEGAPFSGLNRDGAVYPGMWINGADGDVQFNRGEGWVDLASCNGQRHTSIGVNGGFAASPDRVVSFGDDGATCVVDRNTGTDLGGGNIGASVSGAGAYVNGEFWVGTGGQLYRSADGLSWTNAPIASGARFELVADSGEGTIAAASRNGDAFYYSDDNGASWEHSLDASLRQVWMAQMPPRRMLAPLMQRHSISKAPMPGSIRGPSKPTRDPSSWMPRCPSRSVIRKMPGRAHAPSAPATPWGQRRGSTGTVIRVRASDAGAAKTALAPTVTRPTFL